MKCIISYINEKLKITKDNMANPKSILNVNIKSLEHLKDVLTEYLIAVEHRKVKTSRILTKPLKWKTDQFVPNQPRELIFEIGDHFKIEILHPERNHIIHQLNCAEYDGSKYIFNIKSTNLRNGLFDQGVIGFKNDYSPKLNLHKGTNLLDWLNELAQIKSDEKVHWRNGPFLHLLQFVDHNYKYIED